MSRVAMNSPEVLDDVTSWADDFGLPALPPSKAKKPRQKPARFVRLCVRPEGSSPGVVRIAVGKEIADYLLTALPADFGRGFQFEKIAVAEEPTVYHVHLDAGKISCDCKGHTHHGHCKHADGLAALVAAGKL